MGKGVLITLEGNEGSGKTTQIRLLHDYLRNKKRPVFLTREPGGTAIGDGIRQILLDNKHKKMTATVETLLYMASRAQLIEEVVLPKLKEGKIVLCDRWLDATIAYQGYGAGVDIRWIKALGKTATQGIMPALSIFLDLPLECGLARAKKRHASDRMEKKSLKFHQRVRNGYLAIAKSDSDRFKRIMIGETDSIQQTHEKIKRLVREVI